MASEIKSLLKIMIKMDAWEIVEAPQGCKVIDSRIVLRNKYDSSGKVERRKARFISTRLFAVSGGRLRRNIRPGRKIKFSLLGYRLGCAL